MKRSLHHFRKDKQSIEKIEVEQMIELFEKHQQHTVKTNEDKQIVDVEFILKIDDVARDSLTIELKLGLSRLYVVRHIKQLLKAVFQERPYVFTKNFHFDPMEHTFQEDDLNILALLYDLSKHETFYQSSSYDYWKLRYHDERHLRIPPFLADQLLDALTKRNASFQCGERQYDRFSFRYERPPLTFQLDEYEKNYQLIVSPYEQTYFFELYHYLFIDGVFYKLDKESVTFVQPLVNNCSLKTSFTIANSQIDSFMNYVLPSLSSVGHVSLSENVRQKTMNEPLQASLFIDFSEQQLQTIVEYRYGELKFDPLKETEEKVFVANQILLRDVKKEALIMDLLERAPFKYNGKLLYIDDEEAIAQFLFVFLPSLEKHLDVYMTHRAKHLRFETNTMTKTMLDFHRETSLLEVNFSIDGIDEEEIEKIFEAVIEKKSYYRLASGAFISLEDAQFSTIERLYYELGMSKHQLKKQMHIPAFFAHVVTDLFEDETKEQLQITSSLQQLLDHLQNQNEVQFQLPAQLQANLRDYQQVGFRWFKTLAHYQFGGILADDMGLGKTLQSIAFILSERESKKESECALVVCPASLVYNWEREFQQFAPSLRVAVIAGNQEERYERLAQLEKVDVIITSYPLLRRDIERYEEKKFDIVILDEAQSIKNDYTQTTKAVKKINATHRFALSGTPIENSLDELASIFSVILPGLLPSKKKFRQLSNESIAQIVKPFILRRMKRDVLKELPEKIETVHVSELSKKQKELYLGYLHAIQKEAIDSIENEGFQKSRMKILAGLTRLRQLCCHPSLFIENYDGKSGKMEQLFEILEESFANGRRILLFSQFTSMLKLIQKRLDKHSIKHFYLDGQTDPKTRLEMTTKFNEGEHDLFLISLKAGGTGLNLTGADTVILYDLWWNPAVEQQAADRAHRLGQKNIVHVIKLVTKGTIEEKIHELQLQKKALVEQIIQPGETLLTTLSEAEIKELLMLNNDR